MIMKITFMFWDYARNSCSQFRLALQDRSSCPKSVPRFSLSISGSLTADICSKNLFPWVKANIEFFLCLISIMDTVQIYSVFLWRKEMAVFNELLLMEYSWLCKGLRDLGLRNLSRSTVKYLAHFKDYLLLNCCVST